MLSPLDVGGPLARLRAASEVTVATGDLDDLPNPLPLSPGSEAPSVILARLRADER